MLLKGGFKSIKRDVASAALAIDLGNMRFLPTCFLMLP
jgi:hypothetical protein